MNELVPDHKYEEKTRIRDIKKENGRMPFTHQATLNTEKGKLQIGEGKEKKEWKAALKPDPVKSYLLMSRTEEDLLDNFNFTVGPVKNQEGSKFMSFAAVAPSTETVKLLYKKLKMDHQMATHCIGAYRIFGKEHYELQSFCDDGEHGGGRRMLNILKELGLFNVAVFIVRYKDGENIGKARFNIITELTKLVLMKMPVLDRGERREQDDKELAGALVKAVLWQRKSGTDKN